MRPISRCTCTHTHTKTHASISLISGLKRQKMREPIETKETIKSLIYKRHTRNKNKRVDEKRKRKRKIVFHCVECRRLSLATLYSHCNSQPKSFLPEKLYKPNNLQLEAFCNETIQIVFWG